MSTIITPSEEQINIVVNDEKISINVENGDVIVNVTENIVEVSTVNGGYPLPTTVYSVFGRTGNIIAVDGDYDLGELGDVTLVSSTNGDVLTYDGTKWINKAVTGTGTVTSVNMSVPVGLQVSGNPITLAGTLAVNFASGYSLPTNAKQTTWDAAYNDSIVSASVSGTTTKTLTLNQQDGGTITASWTDIDTNLVTSVNGYVGTVVLTTTDIAEGTRLYYTETRVSNNVDVAANTAARHSAVTIGTANGLSLASQVLSLALASASTTGALSSTDWVKFNTAYNDSIVSANVSGTTTKTLTLTQQDAGTITASWTDLAASGTVTSVAATVPAGLTISGSPIASAGTLAFGLDTGYTIPLSTQLVPTGGSTGQILTKNSATNYDTIWSDNYADWTEQLRDTVKASVAINKGQAVYISGANGTNQLVSLASNTTEPLSSKTLGLAMQNLAINGIGAIITEGLLGGLNTSTATAGDPVWLGVSGNLIYGLANKPVAPAHLVYIGVVTRSNINNGEIYVKIQNGFELQELHNVLISSVANNEGLFYETATTLWKNKSIATVLGYTPISLTSLSGVSPLSYNNTTGAFSIAQATTSVNGYLSSTDWTTFNGKQAALSGTGFVKISGTTISYDNSTYYLASNPSAYIALTGLSATAPLSYNNTTGGFTISQAGVSGDGYLSSTDWNTFNNKQASGNYITALSGEATASGPGSAAVTLSTSAVTGKILTGVNITGGSITATDSILVAFGKIQNQINGVLGGAIYQSVWNASTNSPTLTSGTGTKGYYYIVSVAGSTNLDGITDWKVGDWAIFNGTTWNKVDNTDAVSSVNGYTGAVSLTTSDITEGSRLYYTEGRVSANTDVAANTAARHAAVTIGTANGLSLSTQALSLALASTSATGALSSTDWNTFNLKQAALSGTGFVKISGSTISYDNSTYYLASNPTAYISLLALSSSATGLTYTNTTGVFSFTAGYSIPTNASQTQWDTAYNNRISTLNGLTAATQNFSTGMSGTDFNISSTTATHTFNIPSASATARGLLSSADWTTFNNKQSALTNPVTGTGNNNYIAKFSSTGSTIGNSLLQSVGANVFILQDDTSIGIDAQASTRLGFTKKGGFQPFVSYAIDPFTIRSTIGTSIDASNTFVTNFLMAINGDATFTSSVTASSLIKSGGTSSQFLKADGSVDSSTYLTTSSAASTYLPLAGGILTGLLDINYNGGFKVRSGATDGFQFLQTNTNTWAIRGLLGSDNITFTNGTGAISVGGALTGTSATFSGSLTVTNNVTIRPTSGYNAYFQTSGTALRINYLNDALSENISASYRAIDYSFQEGSGNNILTLALTGTATFTTTENQGGVYVTSATDNTTIRVASTITGGQEWRLQSTGGTSGLGQGKLIFKVGSGENSLHIPLTLTTDNSTNGGRVGIGTYNPGNKLSILGADETTNPTLGTNAGKFGIFNGVGGGTYGMIMGVKSDGNVYQQVQRIDGTATAYHLLLQPIGGNVLIGTSTSNGHKLRISGDSYAEGYINIDAEGKGFTVDAGGSAATARVGLMKYGGFEGALVSGSDTLIRLAHRTDSNYLLGGTPTIRVDLSIATNGAATFSSSVTATSFFESSDSRLKTLIQDNYQTKGIASITPKLYTKNGKVELGYYAQDFVGILDSAVSKGEDDMLSLSYREVLVAKVYALEQEIKELKAK